MSEILKSSSGEGECCIFDIIIIDTSQKVIMRAKGTKKLSMFEIDNLL